jgi:beta-xylosidase
MPRKYILQIITSCILLCSKAIAQVPTAPAIAGDFADPSVIKSGNTFYAVGTSSEWAPHFPIYASTDLGNWALRGYVFDKLPDWTIGSFWAPEFYFHNNTYYIYYTARKKSDNLSCIGVATSKYPDRGFVDRGIVVDFGKEAIDAFIYKEAGNLFISFKAYGLDKRPIELLASKLSTDGLKMEGEVFSLLKDDEKVGMEGQSFLKHDGYYYLFYSAGACCGTKCDYNVRVARSKTFKGPYEKMQGAPLLSENNSWKCMGHGTFVRKGNEDYYVFHAYNNVSTVFTGRQGMLAKLSWSNGWPVLTSLDKAPFKPKGISDEFSTGNVNTLWQHDFRHAAPVVKQANGKLMLSGTTDAKNASGIVLGVRPYNDVFTMETTVSNNNAALKGLCFYGDANASVGIGVRGTTVEFWMVKDNKRTVIDSTSSDGSVSVQLRLVTASDHICTAYVKTGNDPWKQLGANANTSIAFLPPWDRSPRAGLHFQGDASLSANFERFEIRY